MIRFNSQEQTNTICSKIHKLLRDSLACIQIFAIRCTLVQFLFFVEMLEAEVASRTSLILH